MHRAALVVLREIVDPGQPEPLAAPVFEDRVRERLPGIERHERGSEP